MAINQSPKILFLVGILCIVASIHARSISIFGDVRILITEDRFLCDKIECPLTAERCLVSKEKDPKDPSVLVRTNICYSATNEELQKSVTNETVDPNSQIKLLIQSSRNGMVNSYNSYGSSYGTSNFDAEKFNKEFNKEMVQFQENLDKEMDNLNKELNEMSYSLSHMF